MAAASGGYPRTVRLLLARGADPSIRDNAGRTALDLARSGNSDRHKEIAALLSRAG